MDSNTLILILGGAIAVVLIAVVTLAANLLVGLRREKTNKKQMEGDIAKWLLTRDNHTRDIASLRSELTSLKNAKNGDVRDTQRIWDRIRALEEDLKSLQDSKPGRSRRRDEEDDDEDDDRYARPRRNGRYAR